MEIINLLFFIFILLVLYFKLYKKKKFKINYSINQFFIMLFLKLLNL